MNIVVCIKQIEQVYARSGKDPERHFLTSKDRIVRINPYDEAALEAALRIKEHVPEAHIILLTLGTLIAEKELRRCLALGAAKVVTALKEEIQKQAREQLAMLAEPLGIEETAQHLVLGRPETEIHNTAAEIGADLIVVGSHGRHGLALIFGSTANGVLHGAACDVLAVRVQD